MPKSSQTLETLTDRQLVRWATQFGGWTYFHCNDQLRDPQGGMTSAGNWDRIGNHRREQIIEAIKKQATEDQLTKIRC